MRYLKTIIHYIVLLLFLSMFSGYLSGQSKVDIINKAKESVVWIHAFNMPYSLNEASYGTGTGYVVSNDGLIMTNHHVIKGINGLIIFSSTRKEPYYGTVIWSDSVVDLAVIKTYNCYLKPLEFADPDSIRQGDETLILGFPGDSYKTENLKVTWGILSSNPADSTIQTTAAINHGNSGGPALNMEGKVIGTVFAKNVGLDIEGVGFIRNIKYAVETLNKTQTKLNDKTDYFGTANYEAYKRICDAAVLGWKASKLEDVKEQAALNNQAKDLILSAIDQDPNYVEAYYFLANYYLIKSYYSCLENKDSQSKAEFNSFKTALEEAETKAKLLKPSRFFSNGELSEFGKEFKDKGISCSAVRTNHNYDIAVALEQGERIEEIYSYILTGKTPELLKKSITGQTSYSGSGSTSGREPNYVNSFWRIAKFRKDTPVRFGVCFPLKIDPYTSNIGFSFGNAGKPNSSSYVSFKHQFSFTLLQQLNNEEDVIQSQRYMIFSWNFGVQAKFFRMARFNPRPYATMGWNPANYQAKTIYGEKQTDWYWSNGAFNFGLDFDIWILDNFGLFVTYEYTTFFPNIFPTLYDEGNSIKMKYSTVKLGILF
jgi:hypothetical protein